MSRWEEDVTDEYEIEWNAFADNEIPAADAPYETSRSKRRQSRSRSPYGSGFGYGLDFPYAQFCEHPPQCLLRSVEGGWSVSAGAEPDCQKHMGRFDLLLNLTGSSVLARHVIPVQQLAHWEKPPLVPEIVLDWPDMGAIDLPRQFWSELVAHLASTRSSLLVFCVGGHGRTGTAIASIMTVCGWESADAIAWVRANYCTRAIETKLQEHYVHQIAGENAPIDSTSLPF